MLPVCQADERETMLGVRQLPLIEVRGILRQTFLKNAVTGWMNMTWKIWISTMCLP